MAGKTVIGVGDRACKDSSKQNVAMIILNSMEIKTEQNTLLSSLPNVPEDGEMMQEMLKGYVITPLLDDADGDILQAVKDFVETHKKNGLNFGRLHFHFSGHGVHNARIHIEPEKLNNSAVKTETMTTDTPTGECMVGSNGKLYAIHDLKHELLKLGSESITVTLDCCRAQNRGTKSRGPTEDLVVKLRNQLPISAANEEKICVLYGSLDGHVIYDHRSFTKELYKVTNKGKTNINILHLARKVNNSWKCTDQRCKVDIVEVGDNWENYFWPSAENDHEETQEIEENKDLTLPTGVGREMPLQDVYKEMRKEMNERDEKMRKEMKERDEKTQKRFEELEEEIKSKHEIPIMRHSC